MTGAVFGRDPYLVPVMAQPGELAVFTEHDAGTAFEALGDNDRQTSPRFAARIASQARTAR